jgi:hypothetical protein
MTLTVPSICQVEGCQEPCQIVSKVGDVKTYMKTCCRHDYMDLPGERERVDTFWTPVTE